MSDLAQQRQFLARLILRTSISLCLLLIVIGLVIFFARGGTHLPVNPSGKFSAIIGNELHAGAGLHAGAFLIAGIVVLLLTPIARLLSGVAMSARARDGLYVVIGLVVLALLVAGLLIGQATA
ncbi:MAG: DUF1634 domain-containing protein [Gammaproteobacteria bacterium]|nr:DUF1634 domain-containing protein [Gammaproteobacteria bacterium]